MRHAPSVLGGPVKCLTSSYNFVNSHPPLNRLFQSGRFRQEPSRLALRPAWPVRFPHYPLSPVRDTHARNPREQIESAQSVSVPLWNKSYKWKFPSMRVPAWAGAKSSLSVNGRRVENEVIPGRFLALARTWMDGDRVEFEVEMPLRLEAVDDANPNTVALMRGQLRCLRLATLFQR